MEEIKKYFKDLLLIYCIKPINDLIVAQELKQEKYKNHKFIKIIKLKDYILTIGLIIGYILLFMIVILSIYYFCIFTIIKIQESVLRIVFNTIVDKELSKIIYSNFSSFLACLISIISLIIAINNSKK